MQTGWLVQMVETELRPGFEVLAVTFDFLQSEKSAIDQIVLASPSMARMKLHDVDNP